MKFFIVLSAVAAVALAKPHLLLEPAHSLAHVGAPLFYAAPSVHVKLVPGAPLGYDGRVVDTPEVVHAKVEHQAAHANEKIALAHEAAKSAEHDSHHYAHVVHAAPAVLASYQSNAYASVPVATSHVSSEASYHAALPVHQVVAPVAYAKIVPAAPLGADGRVVDTPEVAHAKAAHAAAHAHEKLSHSHEDSHYSHYEVPHVQLVASYPSNSYAYHY
ncbi:histidine-rich protein PFHRP-II-like [Venturia canescens]|uniref:histidine-rich protein PFHRP-II-like n=1 Tax=Venturia canescens TaxID=32260 RepID=UPI001C9C7802|nr:histidine-rich protein PFHRP-II-like [Venturia canescens]